MSRMDWPKELGAFRVVEAALRTGTIPFHSEYAFQGTKRFLAVPEINLFPTVLLLPFVGPGRFYMVHLLVVYAIGFAGWLRVARQLRLGSLALAMLILTANLNGYMVAHIGIGHSMWSGWFFLPWVMSGLLALLTEERDRTAVPMMALAFFGMLLIGAIHLWVQAQFFVFLVCVLQRRLWKPWLLLAVVCAVTGLFRLAPAGITFAGAKDDFAGGFPSLFFLLEGLVRILPADTPTIRGPLGTIPVYRWEYTYYLGPAVLLLVAGLARAFKRNAHALRGVEAFAPAAILFALFSFHAVWYVVWASPIPMLNSQRMPTRFLIFAVMPLIMIGCVAMQALLYRLPRMRWAGVAFVAASTSMFLWNASHWRPVHVATLFPEHRRYAEFDTGMKIIEWNEPRFELLVIGSALISLIAIAAVIFWLGKAEREGAVIQADPSPTAHS